MDSGWTLGNLIEGQALDDASLIGLLGKATHPSIGQIARAATR